MPKPKKTGCGTNTNLPKGEREQPAQKPLPWQLKVSATVKPGKKSFLALLGGAFINQ